jgi:hypothetical protein
MNTVWEPPMRRGPEIILIMVEILIRKMAKTEAFAIWFN